MASTKTRIVPSTRPRQPIRQVETNLSAYNRTDPFAAFNALRRLITSLPTRIGGCALKLTSEEYKLSLHLLGIVEPFVGLTPSRRTLTQLPTEILDEIVGYLDKKELMHVGIACRRTYDIVFPRHWEYRVVKCKVSSIGLWNHLIVNFSLAQNVRHVEILDERSAEPKILPKTLSNDVGTAAGGVIRDTDLDSTDDELGMHAKQERFLIAALSKMKNLQSFKWSCCHLPISIDNVWSTLMTCSSLQEVDIRDNMMFCQSDTQIVVPTPLLKMKQASLRSTAHSYGSSRNPTLARVSSMLDNCPNLEVLDITYEHRRSTTGAKVPVADTFFLCSRFQNLRVLTLKSVSCTSGNGVEATAAFLLSHSALEVLHIELSASGTTKQVALPLPPGSLPCLRELRASNVLAASILSCPLENGCVRPLEVLKGVKLNGYASDELLYSSLRTSAAGKTIRRVELVQWSDLEDVRRLVECVPGTTYLDLGKDGALPTYTRETAASMSKDRLLPVQTNVTDWSNVVAMLPDLVSFYGPRFFYPVSTLALSALASSGISSSLPASELSRVRQNQNNAVAFMSKCPKLRRMEHWEDRGPTMAVTKVVVLSKAAGEVRLEGRRIKV